VIKNCNTFGHSWQANAITSGVRCEAFNSNIKGSLVSSHMPNEDGVGLAVDIVCTTSQARYEMVDVAIKFSAHWNCG